MWKIKLTIPNNFVSSIDNNEDRLMYSKSNDIEIMIHDEPGEAMKHVIKQVRILVDHL